MDYFYRFCMNTFRGGTSLAKTISFGLLICKMNYQIAFACNCGTIGAIGGIVGGLFNLYPLHH